MRFYGGTALAYACCFELRSAVLKMLSTGKVNLTNPRDACVITGFLPLHAVAANGLKAMYEWLAKELPLEVTSQAVLDGTRCPLTGLDGCGCRL